MIRPSTVAALAALVAVASVVACTANVGPSEPQPYLRSTSKYAEHYATAHEDYQDFTGTSTTTTRPTVTTTPADPDPVKITSAVNAPAPTPKTQAPATSASEALRFYMRSLEMLNGSAVPAVDAIALADLVCSDLLPNNAGDVPAAADALVDLAGSVPNGANRAFVIAAATYRCPEYV